MQYLWERAMPAKNHRHELGVPARSYGIGGDARYRHVAVITIGIEQVLRSSHTSTLALIETHE